MWLESLLQWWMCPDRLVSIVVHRFHIWMRLMITFLFWQWAEHYELLPTVVAFAGQYHLDFTIFFTQVCGVFRNRDLPCQFLESNEE